MTQFLPVKRTSFSGENFSATLSSSFCLGEGGGERMLIMLMQK